MVQFTRRTALAAPLFGALAARQAGAAVHFDRPIRVVSPYAAGGVGENIMHLLAVSMEPQLGQKLIVEARPGASGNSRHRGGRARDAGWQHTAHRRGQ